MPNYDYECTACKRRCDILETIAEMEATRNSKRCQACESPLRKLFGAPALITETRFFARLGGDDGFGNNKLSRQLAHIRAERDGISTAGKRFFPELNAWCGDASELRHAAKDAGVGIANHGISAPAPDVVEVERPYRVSDKIVEREVQEIVDREHGGSISHSQLSKLTDTVRNDLTPPDMGNVIDEVPVCSLK